MNKELTAVTVLLLRGFENLTLSALNLAVQRQGRVPQENRAYKPALRALLIKEGGSPIDIEELREACVFEVNRRVEAGIFN